MDVCFVIRSLATGGAERQTVELARRLSANGCRVTVLVFYGGGRLESDLAGLPGVAVRSLGKSGRWDMPRLLLRLLSTVREIRPDVLVGVLGVAIESALVVGRLTRTPVVWRLGTAYMDFSLYDWAPRAIFRLGAWLSRWPDAIVLNAEAGRAHHVQMGWSPTCMRVIPQGFDTERFRPDAEAGAAVRATWGVTPDQILVGLPARLDPIKDHETFLRAAAVARASDDRLRFACIGGGDEGYRRRLEALCDELDLRDAVIWAGDRADMPAVFNALDIVALTSLGEGLSNAIGEAMACGVPPVVTDVGDMARLVGPAGGVVPVGDARALADAWLALAADPAQRADAGAAARDRICREYSLERAASAMRTLFEQVASRRAR